MKSQVEHMCNTSFVSMGDPSNNELCVRLFVHLAMDGHQQAIQAMHVACVATDSGTVYRTASAVFCFFAGFVGGA